MHIISVNTGRRERLTGPKFDLETGIFKRPIEGAIRVDTLGLADDAVINTRHHGGPDQAVYLYRREDYAWWSETLAEPVEIGSFGENLTLKGFPSAEASIGTRLQFAEVELEITAPRIPCRTLETRMGMPGFIKRFLAAERSGYYCRVIRAGEIRAGEAFEIQEYSGDPVSTNDIFRACQTRPGADELQRFLAVPIDVRTRTDFEAQLSRLNVT